MTVDTLAIGRPRSILQMARNGLPEKCCAVLVLVDWRQHTTRHTAKEQLLTDWLASSIASAHALLSLLALRITSVRPSWYLRVCALS